MGPMSASEPTNLVVLHDTREQTIEALGRHFANDVLTMDEYERRVDVAQRASTVEELEVLMADLRPPVEESTAIAKPEDVTVLPAEKVPDTRSVVSVLGSATRKGEWTVPRELKVVSVLGETELDFREARLSEGTTRINAVAVLGEVRILVPPGLRVEVEGSAILGEFEDGDGDTRSGSETGPALHVDGVAVLGEVKVTSRRPGETGWQAWRRRRRERKERKRLAAAKRRKQLGPGE
jgi:hypothetical protein